MKAQIATDHKVEIFESGLEAIDYTITHGDIYEPKADDILVVWNRKSSNIDKVTRFEKAGCKVIVAENGYIGTDARGGRLISLALSHHLGKGQWFVGRERRHLQHNFEVMPWRFGGEEIVVLAQRGIGEATDLMWAEMLCQKLQKSTNRPVRLRPHPGKEWTPLEPDLLNAHAVITWASAAAVKAIAFGVPAFYLMPNWVGALAATYGTDIEKPFLGDREPMFHSIGWAQWTNKEIADGSAFAGILSL